MMSQEQAVLKAFQFYKSLFPLNPVTINQFISEIGSSMLDDIELKWSFEGGIYGDYLIDASGNGCNSVTFLISKSMSEELSNEDLKLKSWEFLKKVFVNHNYTDFIIEADFEKNHIFYSSINSLNCNWNTVFISFTPWGELKCFSIYLEGG